MTLLGDDFDTRLRDAAFNYLRSFGENPLLTQQDLGTFVFEGTPIRLMAPQQGIWKPKQLSAALSIRSVFATDPSSRPYADDEGPDGLLRYKWRGTDPQHFDNRALREAMRLARPLILFQGIAKGLYLPIFPVYLVAEEPEQHQFVVAPDEELLMFSDSLGAASTENVRRYTERIVHIRLHQRLFRERVLLAYENRCAICRLQHRELLDAAHVVGDADDGDPVITNGIAMCKIHHAAYDANIFGISPEYRIGVRPDVMAESDGPTLRYALQAIDEDLMVLPRQRSARPDPERLDIRWRQFLLAS